MNLKIKDIVEITNGKLICGNKEQEVESFCKDTRIIKKDEVYVGIKGENFDGNIFWKDALEKDASTVIVQNVDFEKENIGIYKDRNIVLVEDTIKAISEIAKLKRSLYNIPVVGITGSVGKTSTKDIIANVVSQKYKTLKTEGNLNNNIGVPFTILNLRDHEALVIEMGMNHLGEIRNLTKIAKPTISVITNVGTSHIGNLGSRENILKAKLEILEGMEKQIVVINNDNDMLHKWKEENEDNTDIDIKTFGIDNLSECMAKNIEKDENRSKFICNLKGDEFLVEVPVGGDSFILNALCAALVGRMLDLSTEEIQKGIATFKLTQKRREIIKLKNNITLINDSYNASFESMKAGVKHLAEEVNAKRKIAVLGDMFELGSFSEELHRKVGEEVAKNKIDLLFAIGDNSKFIVEEAIKNGMNENNIYYCKDKNELIEKIKNTMEEGDAYLIKASNGMKLFEIVEDLKND